MGGQCLAAAARHRDPVEKRMADELDPGQAARVEGRLEGEHHRQSIHATRDLAHPAAPPRPDLRPDVVEHRHPRPLRDPRQPEVEFREVDQHAEIGRLGTQRAHQRAIGAKEGPQPADDLGHADRGHLARVGHRLHAGLAQPLAADAEHLDVGQPGP